MTRALVLGGGGPVGIAWETGLALGLAEAGVDLRRADTIIGTSAGSVVGAHLALDMDLLAGVNTATRRRRAADSASDSDSDSGGAAMSVDAGMQALMAALGESARSGAPDEERRRALGKLALEAPTRSESWFIGFFADLAGRSWPAGYACTSVDAGSGAFVTWTSASGVALDRAVASSCGVPAVYPPVTIDGRRYMDGGMRSSLNADVAAGHDTVLVVSVTVLNRPGGVTDPRFARLFEQVEHQLDELRRSGSEVRCIGPGQEFLEISGLGLHLMDPTRVDPALDAGRRQGRLEADALVDAWAASADEPRP